MIRGGKCRRCRSSGCTCRSVGGANCNCQSARHLSPVVMAVGLAKFHNDPSRNPLTRLARRSLKNKTLASLSELQASGRQFFGVAAADGVCCDESRECRSTGACRSCVAELSFCCRPCEPMRAGLLVANLATTNTVLATRKFCCAAAARQRRVSGDCTARIAVRDLARYGEYERYWLTHDEHNTITTICRTSADVAHGDRMVVEDAATDTPSVVTDAPAGGWAAAVLRRARNRTRLLRLARVRACRGLQTMDRRDCRSQIERAAGFGRWLACSICRTTMAVGERIRTTMTPKSSSGSCVDATAACAASAWCLAAALEIGVAALYASGIVTR